MEVYEGPRGESTYTAKKRTNGEQGDVSPTLATRTRAIQEADFHRLIYPARFACS